LVGFFDTLRIELRPYGISVTSVYPDFVATETRMRAYGPDGKPVGKSPVQEGKVMSAEDCAAIILKAAAARRRDVIIGLRGNLGLWLKLIAPGLVDRIARRAIARGR
jgi:short-subunit dehydrogenase